MDDIESRFPYECRTPHPYAEVEAWCEQQFGAFDDRWYRFGSDIAAGVTGWDLYDYYRFRDEQAAVLFQLKWS
jgi:hypothetical protein